MNAKKLDNPFPVGTEVLVQTMYNGRSVTLSGRVIHVRSQGREGLWSDARVPFTVRIDDPAFPLYTGVAIARLEQLKPAKQKAHKPTWDALKTLADVEKRKKRKGNGSHRHVDLRHHRQSAP